MVISKRPKIGLALGSGGARGLTQLGILKVLNENNIHIDFIAGASAGSVIGAYYALHENVTGFEKAIKKLSKRDLLKIAYANSTRKGITGEKAMEFLMGIIGDKDFSDTKIPLKIIATDMESGKEVWFDKGKLSKAIRASISLPGIFYPAKIDGKFYLDGGVINPTPVDVVKAMGADIVIAIDHTMSGSVKIKDPSIYSTLMRAFEIIRTQTAKLKMGEIDKNVILIRIENKKIGDSYNFYNKKFINKGVKIAKEHLEEIKKTIENWDAA
jgi:NTE family protein